MFLFGERVDPAGARRVARSIAYLPQGALALGELEVAEAIVYTGILRGLPEAMARNDAETIMEELDLGDLGNRQIRKLSGGQRRLTQVGMTLIGNLPVLILDEPTADIDPALRARIWDLLETRARDGAAILLVTHDVLEAEHVLGRVAIVDKGRVRMSGTPASLKADLSHRVRVELVVAEGAAVEARLLATDLGDDVLIDGRRIRGWVPREQVVATLDKVMGLAAPKTFEDVRLVSPSLEDVYLDVVGHPFEERS
jgi:ABC-2 type transport system ATP-binding protein